MWLFSDVFLYVQNICSSLLAHDKLLNLLVCLF